MSEPVSQQARYKRGAVARGVCSDCYANPLLTTWLCAGCAEKHRERNRKAKACKPWVKGGRGRPPKAPG